jgi:putative FmdB family regulatory protein
VPIYEFACNACGRQSSVFVRRMNAEINPTCQFCNGRDLRRLVSRFAVVRSAESSFDDGDLDGLDENDPQAMARWARRMGEEMGEDLGPDFDAELERMESGESPEDNLGGDDFDI